MKYQIKTKAELEAMTVGELIELRKVASSWFSKEFTKRHHDIPLVKALQNYKAALSGARSVVANRLFQRSLVKVWDVSTQDKDGRVWATIEAEFSGDLYSVFEYIEDDKCVRGKNSFNRLYKSIDNHGYLAPITNYSEECQRMFKDAADLYLAQL